MPKEGMQVKDTTVSLPEPTEAFGEAVQEINRQAAFVQTSNDNARAIATQLGYDGALTVGALEDEIRFYQRRTAEACIELGKRLVLLKELTPRGEFNERCTLLGISRSTAYRFMQAAKKFSNRPNLGRLTVNKESAGKFLELLILDDTEIKELDQDGSVLGIKLDAIDCMSATELRNALRDAREDQKKQRADLQSQLESQGNILKKKDDKINELDIELDKLRGRNQVENREMLGEQQLACLQAYTRTLVGNIDASLNSEILKLTNMFDGAPIPKHIELAIAQAIGLIITAAYGVADNWGIDPSTDPDTASDLPAKADAEAFLKWQSEQDADQAGEE
jgi:hypothetical protein